MSAETVLLDLTIDPSRIGDEVAQKDVVKLLEKGLLEYFPQLKLVFETSTFDGHLCIFSHLDSVYVHARFFNNGIVTINIEFFKGDNEQPLVSFDVSIILSIDFLLFFLLFNRLYFVQVFALDAKSINSRSEAYKKKEIN